MQEAKKTQRPFERQREINQRWRIQWHRVPLREERNAAVVVRIPERNFTAPEALALEMREWIREKAEVARDECFQTE